MSIASHKELQAFLKQYPEITMLELLMPDLNGILRCKRIPVSEFDTFFNHGVKGPESTTLLNVLGEFCDELNFVMAEGDPDKLILPVANSLAPITWLKSDTAQILATFADRSII